MSQEVQMSSMPTVPWKKNIAEINRVNFNFPKKKAGNANLIKLRKAASSIFSASSKQIGVCLLLWLCMSVINL